MWRNWSEAYQITRMENSEAFFLISTKNLLFKAQSFSTDFTDFSNFCGSVKTRLYFVTKNLWLRSDSFSKVFFAKKTCKPSHFLQSCIIRVQFFGKYGSSLPEFCTNSTKKLCSITHKTLVVVGHFFDVLLQKTLEKRAHFIKLPEFCHPINRFSPHFGFQMDWNLDKV